MDETREMKDFRILKFLDTFKLLFTRFGVDYSIMRRLLQIMLIMDGRRTNTIMASQVKKDSGDKSLFTSYILSYGILGVFIGVFMFMPFSIFYKMSIIFGMIMFMVMTTMISDFSSVLLDTRDKIILSPRPIGLKTINAAKSLHILIYLVVITSIIAGPALVLGTYKYGALFFGIFLIQLLTSSIFVIFFTSILYYMVLHFFNGEKLKDMINYFQIMLSIAMMIGYQLLGRAFSLFDTDMVFTPKWWSYLIPPLWFGAPYSLIMEGRSDKIYIVLSFLCILVPLILFLIYNVRISPYFEKGLQKLTVVGLKKAGYMEKMGRLQTKLAGILCRRRLENIFFRFTNSMISNERSLKLKVYPSLAYGVVIPFIFLFGLFTSGRSFEENYNYLAGSNYFLYIYFSVALLANMYITIYSSEKYKGAWIYRALPIKSPAVIYRGSLKRFIVKYFLPIFIFIGVLFFLIYGVRLIPHLIAMFINLLVLSVINFMMHTKNLPFSTKEAPQQEGAFIKMIVSFGYCGLSAFVQNMAAKVSYGLWIYIAIILIAFVLLWSRETRLEWSDIAEG